MAGLLNVFPVNTVNNRPNRIARNVKSFGNRFLCHALFVQCSNFSHIVLRQFCSSIGNAMMVFTAFLFNAIAHIIQRCSKKEMVRIHARRVVTFVADIKRWIKLTKSQLISKTMSGNNQTSTYAQVTVPLTVFTASPKPTVVGFSDVFCETNFGGNGLRARFHLIGASVSA